MNKTLRIVGVTLLIAVVAMFVLPPEVWKPSLAVRMVMGGVGTLALLFSVIARRQPPDN